MEDKKTTIDELKRLVKNFIKERNWGKHHTPKNLAVSIALEAAELLEHFQWDEYRQSQDKGEWESELADIITYCLFFAVSNEIDISKAVETKLKHAAKKYPASVFNKKKDDPRDYWKIKKKYRRMGK